MDGSAGSGQLDKPKVVVFHGQTVDKQRPYPYKNLIRLGVGKDQARMAAGSSKGLWALSKT